VTGPTGVGKSALALDLAVECGGEIVGADASQIYEGLAALTAQPSEEAQASIPHHLVGFLPLDARFDAARYAAAARSAIGDIQARGKQPILVGGSGLYLKALTHGLADVPQPDPELRKWVSSLSLAEALFHLGEADPQASEQIDIRNPARVRRALEIVSITRQALHISRTNWKESRNEFSGIVLTRVREELHERIADHVARMFEQDVISEVEAARHRASPTAKQAIGFSDICRLLDGEISEAECQSRVIRATRDYAKRQLTWCRNQFTFPEVNLTAKTTQRDSLQAALTAFGACTLC